MRFLRRLRERPSSKQQRITRALACKGLVDDAPWPEPFFSLKRWKERRRCRKLLAEAFPIKNAAFHPQEQDENGRWVDIPKREGFFSQGRWQKRVANRRKFRVEVSGNRKWILAGVAVVAVCGTVIYLSVTYGGGLMGLLR